MEGYEDEDADEEEEEEDVGITVKWPRGCVGKLFVRVSVRGRVWRPISSSLHHWTAATESGRSTSEKEPNLKRYGQPRACN